VAFTTAITRSVRAAGLYRSVSRSIPAGLDHIAVTLDSDWTSAYDVALLGIEASFDNGVTWLHMLSAVMYGGARSVTGDLPSIILQQPLPGQYRLLLMLGSGADIGLQIEAV
jgi:hypothetical protein